MILWTDNGCGRSGEGYGDASANIVKYLIKNGLDIHKEDDEMPEDIRQLGIGLGYANIPLDSSNIVINHSTPEVYVKSTKHSVGFTYWETNRLKDSWVEEMNKMNEVWTTSRYMRDVFINSGVTVPVFDFKLGVNPDLYFPKMRTPHSTFTFLSIGSPSTRKNSQIAVNAFIKLFGNDDRFRLIYKSSGEPDARIYNGDSIVSSIYNHPAIQVIDTRISENDLAQLYDQADCLIYPTSGEGWGLLPFQAIAKGIPTICTNATSCTEFAEMSVPLDYKMSKFNMSGIYEGAGEWAEPNFDDLCDKMLYVVNNYENVAMKTNESAKYINKNMTWEKVSEGYVNRICQILKDTKAKL